ncbi:hypothetical protein CL3_34160 [butyrate-producing bacterium SM4/1]|nr:hypothetical protein CL3_34160 [butyrate-producing bacterium SM4/1]
MQEFTGKAGEKLLDFSPFL